MGGKWWWLITGVVSVIRGYLVDAVGLVGNRLTDLGQSLSRWSFQHMWSERDLHELQAVSNKEAMQPTVDLDVRTVCSGCGAVRTGTSAEGWRFTDAPWCPDCRWLA